MSDELQMTDAARMERAIIRIALLLAPDVAAVGVNFDELPGQVQALVAERDRLAALVAGNEWAGVVMRIMTIIDGGKRVWGDPVDEQVVDAVAELQAGRDEADRLLHQLSDHIIRVSGGLGVDGLVDERDRLRAAIDTILDGLVGLDSDDAYVAITTEHLNVVRAALKKEGT